MKQKLDELVNLKADFEKFQNDYKTLKANHTGTCCEDAVKLESVIYSMIDSVYRRINYLESDLYSFISNHTQNHLPPILGPDKLRHAVEVLGLAGDYKVEPRTIYASLKDGENPDIKISL